ncbi:MAG: glycosyltransferase family 2 protein [Deltaproteobacteria bacterium]|nr:MAG: glycosyltransferase family 2 protein [Deltaproteobacteria bacterium]
MARERRLTSRWRPDERRRHRTQLERTRRHTRLRRESRAANLRATRGARRRQRLARIAARAAGSAPPRALARSTELIWLLNNDTTVEPDTLERLVDAARRHPDAAIVGGKVLRMDRPDTLWTAWGRVTWLQSLIALEGCDAPDDGAFDVERPVPWIPGCSILLRAQALREIGLLDESFFAYHEDVEWAARARAAGWSVWYTGGARTYHAVHGSSGGERYYGGFHKYLSARNSVLYAKIHGHIWQVALMAAAIVVTIPFQFARRWLRGEQEGFAELGLM